jgi:hypothetical protein
MDPIFPPINVYRYFPDGLKLFEMGRQRLPIQNHPTPFEIEEEFSKYI